MEKIGTEQQQYQPEQITILKDYIYFAISALDVGLENTRELLVDHDEKYGRTTRKNRLLAVRLENEISQIEDAIRNIK